MSDFQKEPFIDLAGGRIQCRRCQAMSIRRGEQCKKAALKTKTVCAFHGGKSTGPRTKAGKARLVKALTGHGGETGRCVVNIVRPLPIFVSLKMSPGYLV